MLIGVAVGVVVVAVLSALVVRRRSSAPSALPGGKVQKERTVGFGHYGDKAGF
ncbi:hypothetical protein [Couchioplanes caeruleus]|uniref:Uncharacterized protein n=1 Tax=Couchioplanes caeruleus TaxID=56438 RepID=A0A3N1GGU1_9ACTN|nr:hypothetical protein [Couchioplanes caeruleus]ROP29425.1 hypothetical protein EDD30_2219 [Couchioplanes caeruleus]